MASRTKKKNKGQGLTLSRPPLHLGCASGTLAWLLSTRTRVHGFGQGGQVRSGTATGIPTWGVGDGIASTGNGYSRVQYVVVNKSNQQIKLIKSSNRRRALCHGRARFRQTKLLRPFPPFFSFHSLFVVTRMLYPATIEKRHGTSPRCVSR